MSNELIENIDKVHTTAMDRPEFDELEKYRDRL